MIRINKIASLLGIAVDPADALSVGPFSVADFAFAGVVSAEAMLLPIEPVPFVHSLVRPREHSVP